MKGKENKLFLIMLALVLAFALLLTGAEVVFAETSAVAEYVAVDAVGAVTPTDSTLSNQTWTAVGSVDDFVFGGTSDSEKIYYYYLSSNITTTETITIPVGNTVYLTLNGYVIDANNGLFSVITVEEDGILNLYGDGNNYDVNGDLIADTDETTEVAYSGGLITGGNGTDYGILRYGQTAWSTTDSSTNYRAYFGGGVMVNGTFNMYGGSISDIDFTGLENESTSVRIATSTTYSTSQQATISVSSKGSGAVAVDGATSGKFNMYGGYISDNASTSQMSNIGGGGVYVFDSSIYLEREAITKGTVTYPVYYDVVVSEDDFFENPYNETISYPTTITGGKFNMYGGTISGNTSTDQDGGGVYVGAYSTINMSGGTISNNTAENGGGVYSSYGEVNISAGTITDNSAVNGGGVYSLYGKTTISGGTITYNTATTGGGVYSSYNEANISGGSITYNTATDSGGGVYSIKGK
ncbi:MAG: hypothetical protein R3Y65_07190 [Bacillota bacterium]